MKVNLTLVYDRRGIATSKKAGMVELRITFNRVRKYITTGIRLLPNEWSNGLVVNRKDWKELNERLRILVKKCSEVVNKMLEEGSFDLNAIPNMMRQSMIQQQTFIEYAKNKAQNKYYKMRPGTREHYELLFRFLDSWKGIVYFSDITEENILKMDKELKGRGLKECTRWNYHCKVQTFIIQAKEDGVIKVNPYKRLDIKRGNESGLTRYLTPEEFHRFESCMMPTESLKRVRDLFVFQTYTMMGYSDLEKFDYKDCFKLKGQTVYKSNRIKTGKEFTFALMKPALNILKRYNYKLPLITNVKYNLYLKSAAQHAKIDKPLSSHWARHTGATMLLNEGRIDINTISKILGDTLRETERTYAKLMDESIVESMVEYQEKSQKTARLVSIG